MIDIRDYGWDEYFEREWQAVFAGDPHMMPARIITDHGQMLRAVTDSGEVIVNRPVRKFDNGKQAGNEMQIAVGDWVALERRCSKAEALLAAMAGSVQVGNDEELQIRCVLKRKTKFSRAAPGIELKEQVAAANVDTLFLIQSLNRDFNIRRLERYLIAAWESGALPVVVLTKADICEDAEGKIAMVRSAAPGVEVYSISSLTGQGMEQVSKFLIKGKTVALLGSSGVGKSTLVNALAGRELLKTQDIREDDSRGRHTTTHRELVLLPGGGLILDTPGMRTLSLWEADTGMEEMFGDIEKLTRQCRFYDCRHGNEPGCAVREALNEDRLDEKRWEAWLKLQKELAFLESKKEGKQRLQEKQWGKQLSKYQKQLGKY